MSISLTLIIQESDSVTSDEDSIITWASCENGLVAVRVVVIKGSREWDRLRCSNRNIDKKKDRTGDMSKVEREDENKTVTFPKSSH